MYIYYLLLPSFSLLAIYLRQWKTWPRTCNKIYKKNPGRLKSGFHLSFLQQKRERKWEIVTCASFVILRCHTKIFLYSKCLVSRKANQPNRIILSTLIVQAILLIIM